MSFFSKLFSTEKKKDLSAGLTRTRESFFGKLSRLISGKPKIDDELLDELESILLSADVGVETATKIISSLQKRIAEEKISDSEKVMQILKEEIVQLITVNPVSGFSESSSAKPFVVMMVGINGAGKTTTTGKLANLFKTEGKSVMMGAADTFRAAAIEQLEVWAERAGVPLIKHQPGSDPGAVAFDTLQSALAKQTDVVLIDTAGRLQNKTDLMNELSKVRRVMQKLIPEAPHEVLLVLDATTGQNALSQAREFMAATDVTGIVLTKLDGTARGGVVLAIMDQFKIPVRYIGVGEKIDQLLPFVAEEFVEALFEQ